MKYSYPPNTMDDLMLFVAASLEEKQHKRALDCVDEYAKELGFERPQIDDIQARIQAQEGMQS